jgi:hypothetical protein
VAVKPVLFDALQSRANRCDIRVVPHNKFLSGGGKLTPDESDRMPSLCKQIVTEKDRDKFIKLVEELNNLLDRKEQRLEDTPPSKHKF